MPPKRKQKQRSQIPLILIFVGGVVLVTVTVWGLAQKPPSVAAPMLLSTDPGSEAEIERVSLAEAKTAQAAGIAVFLDVRESSAYAASHITGAKSIPLNELERRLDELNQPTGSFPTAPDRQKSKRPCGAAFAG